MAPPVPAGRRGHRGGRGRGHARRAVETGGGGDRRWRAGCLGGVGHAGRTGGQLAHLERRAVAGAGEPGCRAPGGPSRCSRASRLHRPRRRGARVRSARRRLDASAAQVGARAPLRGRAGHRPRQPRALHPPARARRDGEGAAPGERPRHRARAGDARLLRRLGRARQRHPPTANRVDRHGRVRVPPGEESYTAAARLAHARGGARLLLRLLQRGPLAALPPGARAADLPRRRLGPLPAASTSASPRRSATRSTARTRSCWCRTTTSRSRRG